MIVQHFFDPRTSTLTYLVFDEASKAAVIIDPVLDYDPKSGRTFFESVDKLTKAVQRQGLEVAYALDTHPHADHLTALPHCRERFGARTAISAGITEVQATWRDIFNIGAALPVDGRQFDVLLEDGQQLEFGPLVLEAMLTEGHTPASMTYRIGDAIFVGDLLFMPDAGTARCDFPGGSAAVMYDAVQRLYELPDATRVFTLHDYQPGGRELAFESSIGDQKTANVHINQRVSKDEFVALRAKLEQGKDAPTLLFPAVQVNVRGGQLPEPEANGTAYLKIPLNRF